MMYSSILDKKKTVTRFELKDVPCFKKNLIRMFAFKTYSDELIVNQRFGKF